MEFDFGVDPTCICIFFFFCLLQILDITFVFAHKEYKTIIAKPIGVIVVASYSIAIFQYLSHFRKKQR